MFEYSYHINAIQIWNIAEGDRKAHPCSPPPRHPFVLKRGCGNVFQGVLCVESRTTNAERTETSKWNRISIVKYWTDCNVSSRIRMAYCCDVLFGRCKSCFPDGHFCLCGYFVLWVRIDGEDNEDGWSRRLAIDLVGGSWGYYWIRRSEKFLKFLK